MYITYIYIYVNSDICDVWMLGSYESAMWFTDWWPKIEAKFAVKAFKLRGVSKEKRKELESEAVTWTRNRVDPCVTVLVPVKNSVARPCAIFSTF